MLKRPIWPAVLALLGVSACALFEGADSDTDPAPPTTLRFVADAYLQDCRWTGEDWLGVESLRLTLHHDLDTLQETAWPAPGTCVAGLELFAEEALLGGDPVPDLDGRPRYDSPEGSGPIAPVVPGLWHTSAFQSPERCGTLSESVGDGVSLVEAGRFSGLGTPAVAAFEAATADGGRFIDHEPVTFGDTVALAWSAEDWPRAFVQVRREHEGEVRETITCAVSGDGFTVDDAVWDLANDALLADDNRIYLGLVREELVESVDGSAQAWMVLRAIHVLKP